MESAASDIVHAAVRAALPRSSGRPLVVGLCGAQGSGKSTLTSALAARFESEGIATASFSIDDLYLTKMERQALAARVHPLLVTRGVPGTHDVPLGLDILARLDRGEAARLPMFDKAIDDRATEADGPVAAAGTQLILFEGWCTGARPQEPADLAAPVNTLERDEDRDGVWRAYVNAALTGDYQRLFARIDLQILLAAPGFEVVQAWRTQQEHELRARSAAGAPGLLSDVGVVRFIQHYERLTRHILAEMPERAALTIDLDTARNVVGTRVSA